MQTSCVKYGIDLSTFANSGGQNTCLKLDGVRPSWHLSIPLCLNVADTTCSAFGTGTVQQQYLSPTVNNFCGTYNDTTWKVVRYSSAMSSLQVQYTNGAYCGNIQANRMTTVVIVCNATITKSPYYFMQASEPSTCNYKIVIQTSNSEVCSGLNLYKPTVTPTYKPIYKPTFTPVYSPTLRPSKPTLTPTYSPTASPISCVRNGADISGLVVSGGTNTCFQAIGKSLLFFDIPACASQNGTCSFFGSGKIQQTTYAGSTQNYNMIGIYDSTTWKYAAVYTQGAFQPSLQVKYINGEYCGAVKADRVTTVSIVCNADITNSPYYVADYAESSTCVYDILIKTSDSQVCSGLNTLWNIYKPTETPTIKPSDIPSKKPSKVPSIQPSRTPTLAPSVKPSFTPTLIPTVKPSISFVPSKIPTDNPTVKPSNSPTIKPSRTPSTQPTIKPSTPTAKPTIKSTIQPTIKSTIKPSSKPTIKPSSKPTIKPSSKPTVKPSFKPT